MSNVPSPKSRNIMICYYTWSWAAGPASKGQVQCFLIKNEAGPRFQLQNDCPAPFLRQDGGRQVGRAGPAGRGVPGLPGKRARSGLGGPGRAWRARAGQAWSKNPNSPIFLVFLTNCSKYYPGSNYWSNWAPERKTPNYWYFWKTLHTVQ